MRWFIPVAIALILMGCMSNEGPSLPSGVSINATILKINDSYILYVTFTLPNPCHNVSYKGMKAYGKEVDLYFKYVPPKPDEVCTQKVEIYKHEVNLGRLVEGNYTIKIYVNNKIAKELKFQVKE